MASLHHSEVSLLLRNAIITYRLLFACTFK